MSYLASPRIHFAGRFQADTSTVNNDVRHYYAAHFREEFQDPMLYKDGQVVKYNGYWNPEGAGAFRLLKCKVTSAVLNGSRLTTTDQDPILGLLIGGSDNRVASKIVDLDPQQQTVSQLWGLTVTLQNSEGKAAMSGEFAVAPLCDLWLRQQTLDQPFDQLMAAAYQSVLEGVTWPTDLHSPLLDALRARSADRMLSIRMNVFGFDRTPDAADFSTGTVTGTIGPAAPAGPKRFVFGRQLIAASTNFVPNNQVSNIQAVYHPERQTVTADFGNALPTTDSLGSLQDIGPLVFGILKQPETPQGATLTAAEVELLGAIPYQDAGWYATTAGVQDFPLSGNPAAAALIADYPLAVLGAGADGSYTVLNRAPWTACTSAPISLWRALTRVSPPGYPYSPRSMGGHSPRRSSPRKRTV